MSEKVTTMDMRRELGEILNRVALRHDEFIVERRGKPLAAIVPVEKLESLQRLARGTAARFLDRKPIPMGQEEADRLADEAKHRSRKGGRT